jgi:squalene synthase HpnC
MERLQQWDERLQACYEGDADDPIFCALAETVTRFQIPIAPLRNLLTAFRMDVATRRYRKMSEVLNYCQYSANPVGQVILYLFEYRDPAFHTWSDFICTALQLANFWQDVAVDLEKDRIYLPLEDMARFGYTEEDLKAHRCHDAFRLLLAHEIALTRHLFEQGRPLCAAVGRDLRMELRLVWSGGMRILERVEENGYDVFRRRPTITTGDKIRLLFRALTASWTPRN